MRANYFSSQEPDNSMTQDDNIAYLARIFGSLIVRPTNLNDYKPGANRVLELLLKDQDEILCDIRRELDEFKQVFIYLLKSSK